MEQTYKYTDDYLSENLLDSKNLFLRNKLLHSLDWNRNYEDLFLYLRKFEELQWEKNTEQMREHNGFFLLNSEQIQMSLHISKYDRQNGMEYLSGLGLITYYKTDTGFKIKTNSEELRNLLYDNEEDFRQYQNDIQTMVNNKKEEKKKRVSDYKEKWRNINQWKYLDINTFREKMKSYPEYDNVDTIIMSIISKGYWKYQHRLIDWTDKDLNIIRGKLCDVNRFQGDHTLTKEEQTDYFCKNVNYQQVIDVCKVNEQDFIDNNTIFKWMNWSVKYKWIYERIRKDNYGRYQYFPGDGTIEEEDYVKSDITYEIGLDY